MSIVRAFITTNLCFNAVFDLWNVDNISIVLHTDVKGKILLPQCSTAMGWPSFYSNFSHKQIPSNLSCTRNNLPWSIQNSYGLLDKETELFRNIGNQVNLLIEKGFLTSSTYSENPSNLSTLPWGYSWCGLK